MLNKIEKEDFEYILNDRNIDWDNFKNKTILISGASGMLPAYMVKTLLYLDKVKNYNIKIIGIVRNLEYAQLRFQNFLQNANFELLAKDISKDINIEGKVDYIIHAASQATPSYFFSDPVGTIVANTLGTYNLLNLAKEKQVKGFLYFSSGEVCGDIFNKKSIVKECDYGIVDPLEVRNCYSESKRLGENLCSSFAYQYNI